ncbi:MAG: PhoU domain-containing protein [Candidatus Aminicenantes bacterium]|jgi:phosphate uptake regulator
MFKKWLAIFKKDSLLDRAYQRSFEMLDITQSMYIEAKKSLRQREDTEVDLKVKETDKKVNSFEREVRRMVLNHLAVVGTANLPSALVLICIIVDIERIGDYAKNMVELALEHPGKLHGREFEEKVSRIEEAVEDNFIQTKKCFEEGDADLALKLLKTYAWVNDSCDDIVVTLVKEKDADIKPGDAAALALHTRWLKRINSHLRNITTSVVNPFDRIGFEPKEQ